jgi:hypothetical protein
LRSRRADHRKRAQRSRYQRTEVYATPLVLHALSCEYVSNGCIEPVMGCRVTHTRADR